MFRLYKKVNNCRKRILEWIKKETINSNLLIEDIEGKMIRMQVEEGV